MHLKADQRQANQTGDQQTLPVKISVHISSKLSLGTHCVQGAAIHESIVLQENCVGARRAGHRRGPRNTQPADVA